MAKEFRIYTHVWDDTTKTDHYAAVRVPGTNLGFGLFAYREQGRCLYPDKRWIISDIESGAAVNNLEDKKSVLHFASLAECKEWVANIPEEYKAHIEKARTSERYQKICQEFKSLPQE